MARPVLPPSTARNVTGVTGRARDLARRYPAQRFLVLVFDGIGSELTSGVKGEVTVHFDADITGWRLLADQPGDVVIDIWKTDYASYPPTVADTVTAADQPTLASADKADDTALTGWTTLVSAGDTFKFNIDSASAVTRVTLTLVLIA
jgi:hypothetical protein